MDTWWFLCWPKRTEKYPGMDRLNYPSRWCFLCPYLLSSYCVVSAWFGQLSADSKLHHRRLQAGPTAEVLTSNVTTAHVHGCCCLPGDILSIAPKNIIRLEKSWNRSTQYLFPLSLFLYQTQKDTCPNDVAHQRQGVHQFHEPENWAAISSREPAPVEVILTIFCLRHGWQISF